MPDETKNEKFKRIATRRVTNALKAIEIIGNLAGPSYEYSAEEVEKIFSALQETLDAAKSKFSKRMPDVKKFEL